MTGIEKAKRRGPQFLNPVPTALGGLSLMLKLLPRYFVGRSQRSPAKPLGPFHTDASTYVQTPASGLRITWFGHSTSLVEIDGMRLLIDPIWEQRAAPVQWFGPKRFFAPPLPLEQLPAIDAILLSHDHYDHLGADTVRRLSTLPAAANARWIAPLRVGAILARFGVPQQRITELDWTESIVVGALEVTALPARHFSGRSFSNRFHTLWASFVLAGPHHRIFYGADSGEWEGYRAIGQQYGPFDVSMLEIGAFDPLWRDIHMGPDGALRTFEALGATGLLMPIHWGLFNLALHPWRQPIQRMFASATPLWSPEPGLPTQVLPGRQLRSDWWG
jgi:L-ascorbate metabolism protein UlaG (beta-lactamase superfamily)